MLAIKIHVDICFNQELSYLGSKQVHLYYKKNLSSSSHFNSGQKKYPFVKFQQKSYPLIILRLSYVLPFLYFLSYSNYNKSMQFSHFGRYYDITALVFSFSIQLPLKEMFKTFWKLLPSKYNHLGKKPSNLSIDNWLRYLKNIYFFHLGTNLNRYHQNAEKTQIIVFIFYIFLFLPSSLAI